MEHLVVGMTREISYITYILWSKKYLRDQLIIFLTERMDMVPGVTQVAVVEVKTRVSMEKIAEAERIATRYNKKVIQCNFGDEVWLDCVEKDHSNQIMC